MFQNILRAEHIIMGQCLYFCFNSKTQPWARDVCWYKHL